MTATPKPRSREEWINRVQLVLAANEGRAAFADVPIEVYHDRECPGVSNSRLSLLDQSPAHFHAWATGQWKDEGSASTAWGDLVHLAILEPLRFQKEVAIRPEGMHGSSNAYKAWKQENEGKLLVSQPDWDGASWARDNILKHPELGELFNPMYSREHEYSLWWNHPLKVMLKARIDILVAGCILDVKTTSRISDSDLSWSLKKWGYPKQAALQLDGMRVNHDVEISDYRYVFVENEAPYGVKVYRLAPRAIEWGRRQVEKNVSMLAYCYEHNDWPGYDTAIRELDLPPQVYAEEIGREFVERSLG